MTITTPTPEWLCRPRVLSCADYVKDYPRSTQSARSTRRKEKQYMARRFLVALMLLSALLISLRAFAIAPALRVETSSVKIHLDNQQTNISLTVINNLAQSYPAAILIEIVSPQDSISGSAAAKETIQPGENKISLAFPLNTYDDLENNRILWYRLHYRITPISRSASEISSVEGFLSLSEIVPDIFELRVMTPAIVYPGAPFHVRIHTPHPISFQPVDLVCRLLLEKKS